MKNECYALVLLGVYSLIFIDVTQARIFYIQVEDSVDGGTSIRTNAQNMRAVHFQDGNTLKVEFCLRKKSTVTVSNVLFSNDGDVDDVHIDLDRKPLGSFKSTSNSNYGHNWNVFTLSGQIGIPGELSRGRHILNFKFTTDIYGFELDAVEITVDDEELKDDFLYCTAICDDDISYSNIKAKDTIQSAQLVQKSVTTYCGMDRNINYQIFHPTVTEYKITASPPKYRSLLNDDTSDTSGCSPISDVLWEFADFSFKPDETSDTQGIATTTFGISGTDTYTLVTFDFGTDKSVTRMDDRVVGAVLTLELKTPTIEFSPYTVVLEYSSRSGSNVMSTPTNTNGDTLTWNLPVFSWLPTGVNTVKLTVTTPTGKTALVKLLKMERKSKEADEETELYVGSGTKIVLVKQDQWWAAQNMIVTRTDSSYSNNEVTRISVFRSRRYTDGYDEIFQLYQDGMTNINAMVPNGANKVPFGTSFILGESSPSDKRPYASIKSVIIDPLLLKFSLTYSNGGTADLEVKPKGEDTEIHITNAKYIHDRGTFPFAAVRATWVTDGNADIDHVTANQNEPRRVVNGWQNLYGTAFSFFKRCISMHNTQGPDHQLELLNP